MNKNFELNYPYLGVVKSNKLYLYKKKDDLSIKKVEKWLRNYNLQYEIITPQTITKSIVYHMLTCSEKGFSEILVSKIKAEKVWQCHSSVEMDRLTVAEMVQEIIKDPLLLRAPILFNQEKLLAGYNSEEIRKFIPKSYRFFEKQLKLKYK